MKNNKARKAENKKIEQLGIKTVPSSGAENQNHNQNFNARKEPLGPNTKR